MVDSLERRLRAKAPPRVWAVGRRVWIVRRQIHNVRVYDGLRRHPLVVARHVLFNKEVANFTYEIDNVDELVHLLEGAFYEPPGAVAALARELEDDATLREALRARLRDRPNRNDDAPYGRRIGWYVLARLLRPRLVIETGTHDGLGSAVLLRAIERNAAEGTEGRLISIDHDPSTGWLVPDWLSDRYEQRLEDSVQALEHLGPVEIGLAVLDSAHVYEHERRELALVAAKASEGAVVVSDNPGSGAFRDFCAERDARVYEFWEKPRHHIHPGAGLAFARL